MANVARVELTADANGTGDAAPDATRATNARISAAWPLSWPENRPPKAFAASR